MSLPACLVGAHNIITLKLQVFVLCFKEILIYPSHMFQGDETNYKISCCDVDWGQELTVSYH